MKLVMDEAMKHRLIGLTVIIAILAIILPAMLKKNSQRMEERHVAIHLPPQPQHTVARNPGEKEVFRSVKVAHVDLPPVAKEKKRHKREYDNALAAGRPETLPRPARDPQKLASAPATEAAKTKASDTSAKVEIFPIKLKEKSAPAQKPLKKAEVGKKEIVTKSSVPLNKKSVRTSTDSEVVKLSPQIKTQATKTSAPHYAVQLGVFREEKNALLLLKELEGKGFTGSKTVSHNGSGKVYKVTVGSQNTKAQAENLKKLLLAKTRIRGFIVEKGVG